jgi:hypothetical protein
MFPAASDSSLVIVLFKLVFVSLLSRGVEDAHCTESPWQHHNGRICPVRSRVVWSHLLALAADLVTHAVVLALHALDLLLQVLHVAILAGKLLLESANLTGTTNVLERLSALNLGVTLEGLDLLLQAENIEDHDVGAVQDEGEEQGKTAEVHVTLRVELAGLDLHALDTAKAGVSRRD